MSYVDAGSDSEESISDTEEGDVFDTSTDYDSEDEATTNNTNTRHQQSSATTAQQQVSVLDHIGMGLLLKLKVGTSR